MNINTYSTIREMKGRFLNMERVKKKIWKVLLMIPVLLLFSSSLVCQASEIEATTEATTKTSTAASQEAVPEEPTTEEQTTEARKATPGNAWSSTIIGKIDDTPKTLDDIYVVSFWTLLFVGILTLLVLFVFIFNAF